LEISQYTSTGNSKHEIYGDLLGMVTWRSDKLDDHMIIWNWKTAVLFINMVRGLHKAIVRIHST